ncbi:hypothetical protein EV421DRAFT_1739673 [Armillaria borealis]|uniref:Uncharacterized protein n=1 Tax=Armillaria borealis TaxID=47425 RepID=A0AA39J6D8_9AGAR|nr:hypothetical protein EV421DRAFT_1739673 [Armillaria borealis]
MRLSCRIPATNRPIRGPVVAVSFSASTLIVTAMLVLNAKKLDARARRRDLGDDAQELLGANASVYGDEKKSRLEGAVETALVEEAQVDAIPVDDTTLISGRTSEEGCQ